MFEASILFIKLVSTKKYYEYWSTLENHIDNRLNFWFHLPYYKIDILTEYKFIATRVPL